MTPEEWTIVRRSSLFDRLDEDTIRTLIGEQPVATLSKGAQLCRHGEPAEHCHIVISGMVKLYREGPSGDTAIIAMHGPGKAFMLAEALLGGAYSASAETVDPGRILMLDARRLRERIATDGKLAMAMLASASAHLRALLAHIEELKTMTGPARLADFILQLAGARSGAIELSLPYEKQLIANRLGMTPESFSRAIGRLRPHGVIVSRERLTIRDVARLRAFATSGN